MDSNELGNLKEMDKFKKLVEPPTLSQEVNNLDRLISNEVIEAVIKSTPTKSKSEPVGFISLPDFQRKFMIILKLFKNKRKESKIASQMPSTKPLSA